jgi:hypothetical protein
MAQAPSGSFSENAAEPKDEYLRKRCRSLPFEGALNDAEPLQRETERKESVAIRGRVQDG